MTPAPEHLRRIEEAEEALRACLLRMGGMAEEMTRTATAALAAGNGDRLTLVHRAEDEVNRLHLEVDERCLHLVALFQPAAADLRFAMAATRMNADLERIGDQAVNIAQNTGAMLALAPGDRMLLDIPAMAAFAVRMLGDALDAFSRRDATLARSVISRDDEEDRMKTAAFHEIVRLMQSDVAAVPGGLALLLIARNLERIADHTTNIAEDVIFMVEGQDVRHHANLL